MSEGSFSLKVVVRRVSVGAEPFQWEIGEEGAPLALYASEERFRSMQDAYEAGSAWLDQFQT